MVNAQANGLAQAILRSHNPKLYLLGFEPLMVKKSEFKTLSQGDIIVLGKKLPELYLYRKGGVVGQALLGEADGNAVVIIAAKERIDNLGKAPSKYLLLESRIAVIPKASFVVGKMVSLPANSLQTILLYRKQVLVATASLVQTDQGYALQINECF